VLTVSKKLEDGGRFRTIKEALDAVEPGMTIRVLGNAVYEEELLINTPEQHRGVVLEAASKASIRNLPGMNEAVWIRGVPGFTLRGFYFESGPGLQAHVTITGHCTGVILDRLDMTSDKFCVQIHDVPLSGKDAPLMIQNCIMRARAVGVVIDGVDPENRDRPQPCGRVVIRNNTLVRCTDGVVLLGAVHKIHVVGNRVLNSRSQAFEMYDLLPGAADVLVANNTLLQNQTALLVCDDHDKGKAFLRCKNIRFQNNLVLGSQLPPDLIFFDHPRGSKRNQLRPGDLDALLKSPQWRFSHNWREIDPVNAAARSPGCWIPRCPNDQLRVPIEVLSRKPVDPNFLRPPKKSPLARGGAGVTDPSLPAYVGAVPPEGVQPWDWAKTWKLQVDRDVPAKPKR
jgi:hypothetical protein